MALPNLSENNGNRNIEKTLGDINSNIFDIHIEVEDGFKKICKALDFSLYLSLDFLTHHLDNISEDLLSINQTLKDSFKLNQTQQQEKQIELQRAKAEKPEPDKKDKKDKIKKEDPKGGFFFGLLSILGFTLGALSALFVGYFESKINFLRKGFTPIDDLFKGIGKLLTRVKNVFTNFKLKLIENVLDPISNFGGKKFTKVKSIFNSFVNAIVEFFRPVRVVFRFIRKKFVTPFLLSVMRVTEKVSNAIAGIGKSFGETKDAIKTYLKLLSFDIFGDVGGFFEKAKGKIVDIVDAFFGFFKFFKKGFALIRSFPIVGQVVGVLVDFFIGIYKGFQKGLGVVETLVSGLIQIVAGLFGGIPDLIFDVVNFVTKLFGFDLRSIMGIGDFSLETFLYDSLSTIFDFLYNDLFDADTFRTSGELIDGFFRDVVYLFNDMVQDMKKFFIGIFVDAINFINVARTSMGEFVNKVLDIFSKVSDFLGEKFKTLKDTLNNSWEKVKESLGIDKIFSSIKTIFGSFVSLFDVNTFKSTLRSMALSMGIPEFAVNKIFGEEIPKEPKVEPPKVETPKVETPKVEPKNSSFFGKVSSFFSFGGNEKQSESEKVSGKKINALENGLANQQSKFSKQSEALNTAQNKNDNMKQEEKQVSQNNTSNTAIDQSKRTTTTVVQKMENSDPLVGKGYSLMPIF
tara:strand:- start:46 stop:2103 length:2058 start_codon:yes stop_codon:yes gene_type:complete